MSLAITDTKHHFLATWACSARTLADESMVMRPASEWSSQSSTGLTLAGQAELKRFLDEYADRVNAFLLISTGLDYSRVMTGETGTQEEIDFVAERPHATHDLAEFYRDTVLPLNRLARANLAVRTADDLDLLRRIGKALLELIDDSPGTSDERENWLYDVPTQFYERLRTEGLLSAAAMSPSEAQQKYVLAA